MLSELREANRGAPNRGVFPFCSGKVRIVSRTLSGPEQIGKILEKSGKSQKGLSGSECTAVTAIQLRMRMRILTRPENSLANFNHQISKKELQIQRCEGNSLANANIFANENPKISSSLRKIPCEWKFATKFASDCECDGLVHSVPDKGVSCRSSWVYPF